MIRNKEQKDLVISIAKAIMTLNKAMRETEELRKELAEHLSKMEKREKTNDLSNKRTSV